MLEVLAKCSDCREQHLHEYMSEFICKKIENAFTSRFPDNFAFRCIGDYD